MAMSTTMAHSGTQRACWKCKLSYNYTAPKFFKCEACGETNEIYIERVNNNGVLQHVEKTRAPDFVEGGVHHNFVTGFRVWPVSVFYMLAMLALGLHLYHGVWSLFQTLGLNHPRYNALRRAFASAITALVVLGNLSFPLSVLLGFVK